MLDHLFITLSQQLTQLTHITDINARVRYLVCPVMF